MAFIVASTAMQISVPLIATSSGRVCADSVHVRRCGLCHLTKQPSLSIPERKSLYMGHARLRTRSGSRFVVKSSSKADLADITGDNSQDNVTEADSSVLNVEGSEEASLDEEETDDATIGVRVAVDAVDDATNEAEAYQAASAEDDLDSRQKEISSLKIELLATVAGLDRGLSASEADVRKVEEVASMLESIGGEVKLLGPDESEETSKALQLLQGRWRLVYSSGFASGSLGGRRPGPPFQLVLPVFTLGQVYQRIDVLAKELDNIVDFRLTSPIQPPPIITATLAHTFQITGDNSIEIIFEKTSAKLGGWDILSQLPPLDVPQLPPDFLRPSQRLRSGSFTVTFLDNSMRITRGDRGELRVFVLA